MARPMDTACVSDSTVTATAPPASDCKVSMDRSGNDSGGRLPAMAPSMRMPLRSAPSSACSNAPTTQPTKVALRMAGTRRSQQRDAMPAASVTAAVSNAHGLVLPRRVQVSASSVMKRVAGGMSMPSTWCIWLAKISTPMAAVKPTITVWEMKFTRAPR